MVTTTGDNRPIGFPVVMIGGERERKENVRK